MNIATLTGRLTKDPELRYTPSGVAVTHFTLAVQRDFKNEAGEYEADFIPVVVWRQSAEFAANYLRKGKLTEVAGRIQTRNYDNNDGQRIYVTEVVADHVKPLEWEKKENTSNDSFAGEGKPIDISDDDLPF